MLMNINEAAVGLEDGLSLDGDRCIRMIPRQVSHPMFLGEAQGCEPLQSETPQYQ